MAIKRLKPLFTILSFTLIILLITACSPDPVSQKATKGEQTIYVQVQDSCDALDLSNYEPVLKVDAEKFDVYQITIPVPEIKSVRDNECMLRFVNENQLETLLENIEKSLEDETTQKIRDRKFQKSLDNADVSDIEDLKEYLKNKRAEEQQQDPGDITILSSYQSYVQPDTDAVQDLEEQTANDLQSIYDEALTWIWVSEEVLNGQVEYWFYPEEFLTETPSMSTNPSPGDYASDCSEQANTLASLMIASGIDSENVRVTLGLVDFDGTVGGHAWVEYYDEDDDQWFVIDATAGAYYDESTDTVTRASDIPYTYFKYHQFPVRQVWYYYNHEYFWDNLEGDGNRPSHWQQGSGSDLKKLVSQRRVR